MTVEARLRWLIEEHECSATELSAQLGKARNTLSQLMVKLRQNPRYASQTLTAFAELTGASLDWIIFGRGQPYPPNEVSHVDPEYPNRAVACAFAQRSGFLERAIREVASGRPEQDLNPMDWYQQIAKRHDEMVAIGIMGEQHEGELSDVGQ
ncbi:MAG: hypothetical protein CL759_06830 [Chloroflexi bacterium]|nr:hypothetical protein [Chloroflexota bacterium]|tara:strand:- start:1263 stop:1718 length:456 start_codon:yes stop_codon:yes gene_type:complete